PVGACCTRDATTGTAHCDLRNQATCLAAGGTWQGPNTNCTTSPCPQPTPTGACCFLTNSGVTGCQVLTAAACSAGGGLYRGNGTSCAGDAPCGARGACCFTTANTFPCQLYNEAQCSLAHGNFRGAGSVRDPNPCPAPPTGACCNPITVNPT